MAELKHGVYAYVTGRAKKVFQGKAGLGVVLDLHNTFNDTHKEIVVFGLVNEIVSEGDEIKVKGWLNFNDATEERDASISLSKPIIMEHLRGSVAATATVDTSFPADGDAPF